MGLCLYIMSQYPEKNIFVPYPITLFRKVSQDFISSNISRRTTEHIKVRPYTKNKKYKKKYSGDLNNRHIRYSDHGYCYRTTLYSHDIFTWRMLKAPTNSIYACSVLVISVVHWDSKIGADSLCAQVAQNFIESKTSWKQDQWDNEVSSFWKKKERESKTQGGGY